MSIAASTITVHVPHHIGGACAARAEVGRYGIEHYRIASTPDGATYAVATDGRMAAVAPCDAPDGPLPEPVLVPREASARNGVRLSIDDGRVVSQTLTATGKLSSTPAKVHTMPDTDRPFPPLSEVLDGGARSRQWVTVDANLLHRLAAAIGDGTVSLGLHVGEDCKISRASPIYVVGHVEDSTSVHGIGVLMPKGARDWTHDSMSNAYEDAVAKALPAMP